MLCIITLSLNFAMDDTYIAYLRNTTEIVDASNRKYSASSVLHLAQMEGLTGSFRLCYTEFPTSDRLTLLWVAEETDFLQFTEFSEKMLLSTYCHHQCFLYFRMVDSLNSSECQFATLHRRLDARQEPVRISLFLEVWDWTMFQGCKEQLLYFEKVFLHLSAFWEIRRCVLAGI